MKLVLAKPVFASVASCFLLAFPGFRAAASTIDFETQAAGSGNTFTGTPNSPLTIGIATFTGGELLNGELGLGADTTGVYASFGLLGTENNPIEITFSQPVSDFSLLVANGDNTQSYTVTDNLGDTVAMSLPSAGALGAATFSLPGAGLTTVDIISANVDSWSFAIDNVSFVPAAVPEPDTSWLLGAGLVGMLTVRRLWRSRGEATESH